ncbi:uncharacterized protein LOC117182912 [Belonocnema kinseyi]|uniref:uncharacterized protein LOC117182912 n=1 Tax=Belonocnema kinseyi TaxID=2817044 RepID=UPI00143D6ECC|nr:uncharacterized protein LOC117182912 [Belonocnema kinseyi]
MNTRHPPILSSADPLAKQMITWAHHRELHVEFCLPYVHVVRRVWIIGGKRQIRAHIHRCVVCTRALPRPMEQAMAPLPPEQATSVRALTCTVFDFAGPFHLQAAKGRGSRTTKGYVAVFVSFASKGIHLEDVGDLTTESLQDASLRFCGRRRKPAEL